MDLQPAPLFNDMAKGPGGGQAHWVTASDGVRLRAAHWLPDGAAKGTVLLFPGRTEYIEKYGPAAADFAARGFATMAVDWRGQGLADRLLEDPLLGHVAKFPDYQMDVAAFVQLAEQLDLPRPWYLVAHSMGGGIGLRALIEGLPVNACVFTGPMWGILLPPPMARISGLLSTVASGLGLSLKRAPSTTAGPYVASAPFKDNTLTNDADMYRFMQAHMEAQPDLALGGPTINWLSVSLKECAHLAEQTSPALPCITFLGEREQIVDPAAIRDRMNRWPGGELVVIPEGQHEVMMEGPGVRKRVFDQMTALFSQYPNA